MIYGFIIAAGNQTRFNSDVPKALSKIGDRTCLDVNIERLNKVCDTVYVVCSNEKIEYFKDYNYIAIKSGQGCGDAIMKALDKAEIKIHDRCFIQWGDSIIDESVYKALKRNMLKWSDVVVACRYEDNPYVKVNVSNNMIYGIDFSKYGEVSGSGFHDLSVFYGRADTILRYCNEFYNIFYNIDHYSHIHGNEFNFLDLFNDTAIMGNIVKFEDNIKSYSFNTEEEYNEMIEELGELI